MTGNDRDQTVWTIVRGHRAQAAVPALGLLAALGSASPASAHDLDKQLKTLERGVAEIGATLKRLSRSPVVPKAPRTYEEQQRVLGAAEIDLALGEENTALQKLYGRIADPAFQALPEYVPTLLLAAEILEKQGEPVGAMIFSRRALDVGGTEDQMAEAGSRWFRIARRQERLGGRREVYDLWQNRGGAKGAGEEIRAVAGYEAAFALRDVGRRSDAQRLLSTIPSESAYGSRAAYLSGVIFVEQGDLDSAVQWFKAVMAWGLPPGAQVGPQRAIEEEIRDLAALSAGRLLYEKGDLEAADEAYAQVADRSLHLRDACYERAFLAIERKERRAAMRYLGCVMDLGAKGDRYIDVRLAHASLLAHLSQYSDSVAAYEKLHGRLLREEKAVDEALASVAKPSSFLFSAMERSAATQGRDATPGPATLFGDAWSRDLDRAYRLDRDIAEGDQQLQGMLKQIGEIKAVLSRSEVFPPISNRRKTYERLLREVQHLSAHAADLAASAANGHASASDKDVEVCASCASSLLNTLDGYSRIIEGEMEALDQEEKRRTQEAATTLAALQEDLQALSTDAVALALEVTSVADEISRESLVGITKKYADAVMRAEAGVLDTFWIRKEHVSARIREIGLDNEKLKADVGEALKDLSDDLGEAPPPAQAGEEAPVPKLEVAPADEG
ncbi:MAG: hypothetical protein U1E65_14025 [Myxococcota bacterium]